VDNDSAEVTSSGRHTETRAHTYEDSETDRHINRRTHILRFVIWFSSDFCSLKNADRQTDRQTDKETDKHTDR